ncbi:MAG: hypothetical protein ABI954_02405 [Pyrinomonadaceae bacterium]
MAAEQSGDPGRTPGSAEGDRETVEQDLDEKGLNQNTNPPTSGQDVNQHSHGTERKETGKVIDEQDDWINKRV